MVKTTRKQREALARVHSRKHPVPEIKRSDWLRGYRAFRRTVQPGYDCIMVHWCGMWLGIEPDGYTHS
ncbi:hypothetical protein [Bradyrhizobium sp. S3.7.6]